MNKPDIVTICGSMKFFAQMLEVAADETAMGNIVLAPFSVVAPEHQGSEFKQMLDELHRRKIDMAHKVIVVTNQHGYIGESTRNEMVYAAQQGKTWDIRRVPATGADAEQIRRPVVTAAVRLPVSAPLDADAVCRWCSFPLLHANGQFVDLDGDRECGTHTFGCGEVCGFFCRCEDSSTWSFGFHEPAEIAA